MTTLNAESITCGEATMRLLASYGVEVVFGIPGVHTLDFCHSLVEGPAPEQGSRPAGAIRHIQARNEQGAGFMADGYARASGRPGVALVISGPGVTNALTAVGQSWADSIPMLLVSSETDSATHGKGWGALHEIPDQQSVTAPLTALSLRATEPDEVPELVARAFSVFATARPRPVHLSIPVDVAARPVVDNWRPSPLPTRPDADPVAIAAVADALAGAARPVLLTGGGAVDAAEPLRTLVDAIDLTVVASNAGKGVVPDDHPLSLSGSLSRPEVRRWLASADVVLAVGTELAETDHFADRLNLRGRMLRVDIDPRRMNDLYPADVAVVADAGSAIAALNLATAGDDRFRPDPERRGRREVEVASLRSAVLGSLNESEARHAAVLNALAAGIADDAIVMGDVCQLVYTGAFVMDRRLPRTWSYPAGFCTLGSGMPNAIGAKVARPGTDVVCLAGDGGVMFTIQELMVAVEEGLGLPVIIWDNAGLKQIRDDMADRGIAPVGVSPLNPDFVALAESMGADGLRAGSMEQLVSEVERAGAKDRPTVIVIEEAAPWLIP